jgi:hypothetical protein
MHHERTSAFASAFSNREPSHTQARAASVGVLEKRVLDGEIVQPEAQIFGRALSGWSVRFLEVHLQRSFAFDTHR